MLISEAVKEAMKTGGKITREEYRRYKLEPTNTPDGFIIFSPKSESSFSKWWKPCAVDLIADDWEVVK